MAEQLIDLREKKRWKDEYYVITELVHSDSTTSIMSSAKNAIIQLEAKSPAIPVIDLADAQIKLNIKSSRNVSTEIISEGKTTPLFRLSHIEKGIIKEPVFTVTLSLLVHR